jgi:hypothetical protein
MKLIFVSHAGADSKIASELAQDLRNAGHDALVDTKELGLGDDSIDFMNEGIAKANAVIILYSRQTAAAKWQRLEINAALWNEVEQSGGNCIVLRLDDTPIPPLLGPKVYGWLDPANQQGYRKTIEDISRAVLPETTATSVVNQALSPDSPNPFRRIRAEFFEERSDLLGKAFASPEASKTGTLEEVIPCFVEGSRGTGKSMLLLSLRGRVFIPRHSSERNPARVFGFYIKLTRGALCNIEVQRSADGAEQDPDALTSHLPAEVADIAAQELVICLLESLFSELDYCSRQKHVECDSTHERALVAEVSGLIYGAGAESLKTFSELLRALAASHRSIAEFIRRKFIYRESPVVPIATLDFDAFKHIIELVRTSIPAVSQSMFVALLDEYENLFPYQQRIVNTFVKLAAPALSVKIAKKLGTRDVSATTIGQDLQETHDYARVVLVYDVEDASAFKAYRELLEHIVTNLLEAAGLRGVQIGTLLPRYEGVEVDEADVLKGVATLCKVQPAEFVEWGEQQQREKLSYYREAAIYRNLYGQKGRQREKRFAGFKDLAFLSSGVIRYFQEMAAVGYYLTFDHRAPQEGELIIPPENQTRAVHFVSTHNVTTLSRNVEAQGETLKYFLFDLGDCLRQKLLKHSSEPEAARLTITDPEALEGAEFEGLRRLLTVGTREGVFQTKEGRPAFKPRHSSDPQPSEFNISRIFAPVLQISPRLRWRTSVSADDLRRLLDPGSRAKAKKALMKNLEGTGVRQHKQPGLL